jgi:hypothetical protein
MHLSNDATLWQTIVDVSIGLKKIATTEQPDPNYTRQAAIEASSTVPRCNVCERVYAHVLINSFSIDEECVRDLSGSHFPNKETLFAIGRSALMGLEMDLTPYADYCLKETCLGLYDFDLPRAADGILALAAINRSNREALCPTAKRFQSQALASLSVLLNLFPDPHSLEVLEYVTAEWPM